MIVRNVQTESECTLRARHDWWRKSVFDSLWCINWFNLCSRRRKRVRRYVLCEQIAYLSLTRNVRVTRNENESLLSCRDNSVTGAGYQLTHSLSLLFPLHQPTKLATRPNACWGPVRGGRSIDRDKRWPSTNRSSSEHLSLKALSAIGTLISSSAQVNAIDL